ncbi:MAG: hypothetical protein J7647_32655 [Cyanobacteria bacterium SBLK]|nr:hypothetical protein [Cyanobacteria bacterium SBLK]
MSSGIYTVAHIGDCKLFLGDALVLSQKWPSILEQLNAGKYPDAIVQKTWQQVKGKRKLAFYTKEDLVNESNIINLDLCSLE